MDQPQVWRHVCAPRAFRVVALIEGGLLVVCGVIALAATLSCRAVPRWSPVWMALVGLPALAVVLGGVAVVTARSADVRRCLAANVLGVGAVTVWYVLAFGRLPLR